MKNTITLALWLSVSMAVSFVIVSYVSNIVDFSMAQNDTQNQTQTQNQSTISQSKFLKNSTSFGMQQLNSR